MRHRILRLKMPPSEAFTTEFMTGRGKKSDKIIICNGIQKTLRQWCITLKLAYEKALVRYAKGMSAKDVLLGRTPGPYAFMVNGRIVKDRNIYDIEDSPEEEDEINIRDITINDLIIKKAFQMEKKIFFRKIKRDFEVNIPDYLRSKKDTRRSSSPSA